MSMPRDPVATLAAGTPDVSGESATHATSPASRAGGSPAPQSAHPTPGTPASTPEIGAPAARLYGDLADWWPLMSAPDEYVEEAALYTRALLEAAATPPRTLLELGSGGGNNASHMKAHFRMTLVEPAPGMLEVSRALNPELEHIRGDMRTVRLERTFDAVFIHDAIMYMTSEAELRTALETAFVHTRPGGVALFTPDSVKETLTPSTDNGGNDGNDRAMRWLEWRWDPDPADTTYLVDYAYVLRDASGQVRLEHDRHVEGVFPRATWLRLLEEVGFEARRITLQVDGPGGDAYDAFVGIKPGESP